MANGNFFDQFDSAPTASSTPTAASPTAVPTAPASGNFFDQFDEKPAPAADAPPETAARVTGLGERALIQGIGHLADTPGALMALADRAGLSLRDYTRSLLGLKPGVDAFGRPEAPAMENPTNVAGFASKGADLAGLPTPATPGERIGSAAVEALPTALMMPAAPITGALSSALGGAGSQAAAEAGGGPLAQTLAGLAAGSVPAAASGLAGLTRLATRGGAAGQAATEARLADAATNGTSLTAGQATGSTVLQKIEGASSKMWGGGPLQSAAKEQTQNLGNHVENIVENLSQGNPVSPTTAGTAINAGGNATKATMRQAEQAAYSKVDSLVPPDAPVDVSGTLAKLNALTTPTPGAANTTASLLPSKLVAMRDNLQADIAANGGSTQLPYSATTALRTSLGNSIDWGFAPADPVNNEALKLVHGALKGDIDAGASAISPQASQAVSDARALYSANQDKRDFLNSIIDKSGGPEAVYTAATNGTKSGATKIDGVMSALNGDQQNLVRATVIDRLGKAIASQQNAAGSAFDGGTFLTNWNKLDSAAKDALFGSQGTAGSLRASLDSLSNTMSTVRSSTLLKNPSGTGSAVGHGIGLSALFEGGGMALAGHPAHLGALVGSIAGNNILARALTNPRTAQWLATSTKLPVGALPNAVNQLAQLGQKSNDPDARDLAAYLRDREQRE